jgi:pimeloyl-ACP methyl ester carboxylesterase
MNKHIFLDRLTARIGALAAGKKKFFSESLDSPSFEELVRAIGVDAGNPAGEAIHELTATTPSGVTGTAYRVAQWLGWEHPTIIYHHGNNERPFDFRKPAKNTFLHVFVRARKDFAANLIVVRAPYHDGSLKEYKEKMTGLQPFMTMLATSVALNEALVRAIRAHSDQPVITCGISLGGWATNLHRSLYNSSTAYVPVMAGTFLGELFLQSAYSRLTGKLALEHPEQIRQRLNFSEAFGRVAAANVFPLLARHDQFIEFDIQSRSYEGHPVAVLENGHVTGALNAGGIRDFVLQVLNKLPQ